MVNTESTSLAVHVRRIHGEYLEMPGLSLTQPQAQRLWGLDADTCRSVLELLVEARFLRMTDGGRFARLTDGTSAPALRMAKASLPRPAERRAAS